MKHFCYNWKSLSIYFLFLYYLFFTPPLIFSQKAIRFNTSGDYIEVPHASTLSPNEFTIEFWIKVKEVGDPNNAGGEQTILDKRGINSGYNIRLAGTAFPLPIFAIVEPGSVSAYSVIRWEQWHHVTVVQDNDSLKIYIDGGLINADANTYNSDSDSPLRIGEFLGYPGLYLGLRGDLDDLRIWNYSRNHEEIVDGMHEILTGSEAGLAALWNFESISGANVPDLSPNKNDGTIYGGASQVDSEAPIGFIPPTAPVGLRAYGGEDYVELAWEIIDNEAKIHKVYRGDSLRFILNENNLLAEIASPISRFIDNSISLGENYYYSLRASDGEYAGQRGSTALGRTQALKEGFFTGVYYYPWYVPELDFHEWPGQYIRYYLVPQQPPMLGEYSSRDPIVIQQHLSWMEDYGIDFLVSSWWGHNSHEHETLRDYIMPEITNTPIKFSVYYESAIHGINEGQIVIDETNNDRLISNFNLIADTYFDHPNYLRIDGRPVVFLYLSSLYAGDYVSAFTTIRNELSAKGYDLYLIGDEVDMSEPSAEHMAFLDGVSPYIILPSQSPDGDYALQGSFFADLSVAVGEWEKVAEPLGKLVVPNVNPGFSSVNGFTKPRQSLPSRENTSFLEEYIKVMRTFVDTSQKMIMITSWNEWHEDTEIEPTVITEPTNTDISGSGSEYTLGYTYEGFGLKNLELVHQLLASEHYPDTCDTCEPVENPDLIINPSDEFSDFIVCPNPIWDNSEIQFQISTPSLIKITVYNIMGKQVHTICGHFFVSGHHSLGFDANILKRGVYFIRLDGESFSETQKIFKME